MADWNKTDFPGVRYRTHKTRKHGVQLDRYYTITHKPDGTTKTEVVGWASEGIKPSMAFSILNELKRNKRMGQGPRTLKEKRELEEKARQAEKAKMVTLNEFWETKYKPIASRSKKSSSFSKEESHYNNWIEPLFTDRALREIDLDDWDELVKTLDDAELSERSVEYITGTMRRIMKLAYNRRLVDHPPPSGKQIGVTAPKDNRRLRVISDNEQKVILSDLKEKDFSGYQITQFAFLTGCRASEAFNLCWKDVDLDSDHPQIRFGKTKNKDTRVIHMGTGIQNLLRDLEKRKPGDRVFLKRDGQPYREAPYSFRTTVKQLGFNEGRETQDRITFHSIRHTVATWLAQRLNLRDLMDIMGWRTVEMAMRYVHSNEAAKAKALEELGNKPSGKVIPLRRRSGNE